MTLPELFNSPVALAGLTLVLAAVLYFQRTLTYSEYKQWHRLRLRVFPPLSRLTSLFLVSEKGYRDDAEYVTTVKLSPPDLYRQLTDAGLSPHLLSSIKRRETPTGVTQYSILHFVKQHGDTQSEVYCFEADSGAVDIYAHNEATVLTPEEHLEDTNQQDGDPRGVIPASLIQEP